MCDSISSLANFRQIKGTRLYRSAFPDALTALDITQLKSMGIKHIVDLRGRGELVKAFEVTPVGEAFVLCNVSRIKNEIAYDLIRSDKDDEDFVKGEHMHYLLDMIEDRGMVKAYMNTFAWYMKIWLYILFIVDFCLSSSFYRKSLVRGMAGTDLSFTLINVLDLFKFQICTVLRVLSEPGNNPSVFCCAVGRDRTGVVAALVQSCLGWSREEIIEDFTATHDFLQRPPICDVVKAAYDRRKMDSSEVHPSQTGALAETMEQVLDHLQEKYGGVDEYLEDIGFGATERTNLTLAISTS